MTYTNSFFGVPEDDRGFNLKAAVDTYEWVLAHPDEAPFVISKMLFDFVPADIERNRGKVSKAAEEFISKRLEVAKRGIARTVSKGISESEAELIDAIDQISKAYDEFERAKNADKQLRDQGGRFAPMGRSLLDREAAASAVAAMRVGDTKGGKYRRARKKAAKEIRRADARSLPFYIDPLAVATDEGFARQVAMLSNYGASDWNFAGKDDYRTDDRFWRRMATASGLGAAIAAGTGNEGAATALAAGKFVGDMAPEAEKIIGPTARRAAYRYRGTEKTPNPVYQRLIDGAKSHFGSGDKAHEVLLRGSFQKIPVNPGNPQAGMREIWHASPLIERMEKLLPDPQRYHLNRKSGTIPPSQGIIIDQSGKVVAEAVGYGEDWYLPFNLKNMNRINGGEYIRTRAFGGPTTEDIYAGLVSGARAVTVVSHSGTFTVEFDESFVGSKRYNDKAGRMQKRYGQLLDAVKSREVSLGSVPPERMEELKAAAARRYSPDLDAKAYKDYLKKLQDKEHESPKLAEATKNSIREQILNEHLQEAGTASDYQSFLMQTEERARTSGTTDQLEKIGTPEKAIEFFGLEGRAKKEIEDAQATYEQEMNPLDLNGRGYYQALKSLQDQFPYYIKDVWHTDSHNGAQDFGYVKANFIRPEGALAGYYDPTITGKGKVTADRTKYQNYPVMKQPEFQPSDRVARRYKKDDENNPPSSVPLTEGKEGEESGPKGPVKSSSADQIEATLAMLDNIRAQTKFGSGAGAPEGRANSPITPADLSSLRTQLPAIFGKDPDETRLALYRNGMEGQDYAKLRQELDTLLSMEVFNVSDDVKRAYQQGRTTALRPAPINALEVVASYPMIDRGTVFDFEQVPMDRTHSFYTNVMEDYLKGAEGLREAGITPESTRKEVVDAAKKRGQFLAEQYRIWSRKRAGLPVPVEPAVSEDDIEREGTYTAYVVQAAVLRDQTPMLPEEQAAQAKAEETALKEEAKAVREASPVTPEEKERLKSAVAASGVVDRKDKVKELQGQIQSMIGMDQVSKEIDSLINEAEVNEYLKAHGMPVGQPIRHMLFLGAPGTGKTTVAGILAPIYAEMGLIPSNKVVVKSRDDLVQANQGNTEAAVKAAFEEAKGGVLFIDEAYSLKVDEMDTLGQIALNSINQKSSENQNDTVVILAGYPDDMDRLLQNNEGLRSRFPTRIHFRNYNSKEMKQIAEKMMGDDGFRLVPGSRASALLGQATNRIANDPNSANGRDVFNLYQKIVRAHKNRLAGTKPTKSDLEIITADDVIEGIALYDENFLNARNSAA